MSKVSFIIPVYNCEQYLENCVQCIVEAKLPEYEIVLVNDGSRDKSAAICDVLANENQNIKCIHQENQGVSKARNNGIQNAEGELVVFVDADDSIDSEQMKQVIQVMEANPQIDMALWGISFDYYYQGKCYRQDQLFYPVSGIIELDGWLEDFSALYEVNALSPIWNKVYRNDILKKYQIMFNEKMFLYEDLEFSIRYMANCNRIYNSTYCVYHYRQAEDEGNAGRRLKRIPHLSSLVDKIEMGLDYLVEKKNVNEESSCIKNILVKFYLGIAHEKIAVSSLNETKIICQDFINWRNTRTWNITEHNSEGYKNIVEKRVYKLQMKRYYTRARHAIAVRVKNTRFYQKRRGTSSI